MVFFMVCGQKCDHKTCVFSTFSLICWLSKSMVFFRVWGQKGDHKTCVFRLFRSFVGSVNRWSSIWFGVKKATTTRVFFRLFAHLLAQEIDGLLYGLGSNM